jgi:hypothetical protein
MIVSFFCQLLGGLSRTGSDGCFLSLVPLFVFVTRRDLVRK